MLALLFLSFLSSYFLCRNLHDSNETYIFGQAYAQRGWPGLRFQLTLHSNFKSQHVSMEAKNDWNEFYSEFNLQNKFSTNSFWCYLKCVWEWL